MLEAERGQVEENAWNYEGRIASSDLSNIATASMQLLEDEEESQARQSDSTTLIILVSTIIPLVVIVSVTAVVVQVIFKPCSKKTPRKKWPPQPYYLPNYTYYPYNRNPWDNQLPAQWHYHTYKTQWRYW